MKNLILILLALLINFYSSLSYTHPLESQNNLSVEEIYHQFDLTPSGKKSFLTIGNDSLTAQQGSLASHSMLNIIAKNNFASVIEIDNIAIEVISTINHQKFKRCGGYFLHNSLQDAQQHLTQMESVENGMYITQNLTVANQSSRTWGRRPQPTPLPNAPKPDYTINQQKLVHELNNQIDEMNIRKSIIKLSSYKNRYYQSATGAESAKWIASEAKKISKHRNDVHVELVKHSE